MVSAALVNSSPAQPPNVTSIQTAELTFHTTQVRVPQTVLSVPLTKAHLLPQIYTQSWDPGKPTAFCLELHYTFFCW